MNSVLRPFMVRRLGAAVMAIGLAVGAAFGQCEHLYTDNQARALTKRAEATVPKAQFRRKPLVLKSLGIDIHRLCNRRFQQINLGATEAWQMAPNYDLTWWAAGPDRVPLDSDNALIHNVRIVHR